MGNGMNRVLPGLYVGNYRDSKDAGQLERHKITHIIAIHDAARRLYTDKEYLCIMASDTPYQNLSQYFATCNDFIHCARIQGGCVLIHCLAGMSRSVTICVAYIMSITSLHWNEALKVVRGARAVSNPNSGFQKQLQEFESTKLVEERRRMLEKWPGTILEHDEENCRRLLIAYDHLLLSKAICEGRCASARICPTGSCRAHCASPRFPRQRSGDNSSTNSPRGSTKSLDSSGCGIEPPSSPRSWERHYGCWKNHPRNQAGSSSTPGSPILYRAAKSPSQRSDSMLSISSMSSITSLPGQIALEKADGDNSTLISLPDRNSLLSSQSCPNSPRRMPRKLTPSSIGASGSGSGSSSTHTRPNMQSQLGVSQIDLCRSIARGRTRKPVTLSSTPSTSTTSLSMSTSGGTLPSISPMPSTSLSHIGSHSQSQSQIQQIQSQGQIQSPNPSPSPSGAWVPPTTASSASSSLHQPGPSATASGSNSSPASPGACHRFMAHNARATQRNTIKVANGITRWVMKRSAYKFNSDKS